MSGSGRKQELTADRLVGAVEPGLSVDVPGCQLSGLLPSDRISSHFYFPKSSNTPLSELWACPPSSYCGQHHGDGRAYLLPAPQSMHAQVCACPHLQIRADVLLLRVSCSVGIGHLPWNLALLSQPTCPLEWDPTPKSKVGLNSPCQTDKTLTSHRPFRTLPSLLPHPLQWVPGGTRCSPVPL
jgi:hypothetical protein